ncbi:MULTISPECIES: hypothetical protein [Streptomyces]|uniref:hypothetical protein n=1 Tax=Streptomyces TaxID=1883 RepID=UPI00133160D5|nr:MULTISPECIES: hypothetical protein [Streptomyces]MZD54626.1 hypothetical protein [Streptomyces sp. SID5606]
MYKPQSFIHRHPAWKTLFRGLLQWQHRARGPARPVMCLAAAALGALLVLGAIAVSTPEEGPGDAGPSFDRGSVCRSLSDPRYEVSCARVSFGDVRYNCTTGRLGRCPDTTAVTLRNVSRVPLKVFLVTGSGESGHERQSPASVLAPERTVTLRPPAHATYVFDVVVRSMKRGVGTVEVVSVG